jgi:hypothetical protein
MTEPEIRATATFQGDGRRATAPDELVAAMVAFEDRYGGLSYPLVVGNTTDYGLDGDATGYPTPYGPAFAGIVDGDLNWPVDVLVDGRTAVAPGAWSSRIIDRSVDQRLEKDALLALVRRWPHRAYECFTPVGTPPAVPEDLFPPSVPEASGPADRWWYDKTTAVQVCLRGWPPSHDHWLTRVFARTDRLLADLDRGVRTVIHDGEARPAGWCELCPRNLPGAAACDPHGGQLLR